MSTISRIGVMAGTIFNPDQASVSQELLWLAEEEAEMEWLGQNWLWIVLAVGAFFFMTRMGGCGMGRSSSHHRNDDDRRDAVSPAPGNRPGNLFDPVSGHGFFASGAPISTVYHGRAYYFENRENRDSFEAAPEKYLASMPVSGDPIGTDRESDRPRQRRHGC
jgi:YHS domain-containing protein